MSEYINTQTTKQGGNATGDDALEKSQSGIDTPMVQGGTAVPFPNLDSASSLDAGPIGAAFNEHQKPRMILGHRLTIFPHQHTCGEPGCLTVFATYLELKRHTKSAGHKPYRCECGHLESYKYGIGGHLIHAKLAASENIVHTQAAFKEPHTCAEEGCHRVCSNGSKLQEHAKVTGHKAYQCVCSRSYSRLCPLGRHIDESRDDGEGKYDCSVCKWESEHKKWVTRSRFKRPTHLQQHLKAKHRLTAEEMEAILLPFRKRKTRASKSALTTGPATKQNAAPKAPSPKEQPDSFVGSTAEARTDFLALTTGAIPLAQDANTTAMTEGPAEDLADLDVGPVDFNLGTPSSCDSQVAIDL